MDREPDGLVAGLAEAELSRAPIDPGTWTRPKGDAESPMSEGSVAWAVIPTGREWGTAMGMPCVCTTRVMPRRTTSSRMASTTRSHW